MSDLSRQMERVISKRLMNLETLKTNLQCEWVSPQRTELHIDLANSPSTGSAKHDEWIESSSKILSDHGNSNDNGKRAEWISPRESPSISRSKKEKSRSHESSSPHNLSFELSRSPRVSIKLTSPRPIRTYLGGKPSRKAKSRRTALNSRNNRDAASPIRSSLKCAREERSLPTLVDSQTEGVISSPQPCEESANTTAGGNYNNEVPADKAKAITEECDPLYVIKADTNVPCPEDSAPQNSSLSSLNHRVSQNHVFKRSFSGIRLPVKPQRKLCLKKINSILNKPPQSCPRNEQISPTRVIQQEQSASSRPIPPHDENENNKENVVEDVRSSNIKSPCAAANVPKTARSISSAQSKSPLRNSNRKSDSHVDTSRKREIDVQAAQEFIKRQRMMRKEQARAEKVKKTSELEEKRKKLEELRIKSLQLAKASKRKPKNDQNNGNRVQEDPVVSLGLQHSKPKLSFQQCLAKLNRLSSESGRGARKKVQRTRDFEKFEKLSTISDSHLPEMIPQLRDPTPEKLLCFSPKEPQQPTVAAVHPTLDVELYSRQITEDEAIKNAIVDDKVDHPQNLITVHASVVEGLKQELKQIAEGFKVLEKKLTEKQPVASQSVEVSEMPNWLTNFRLKPHPYNIITAMRNKWGDEVMVSETSLSAAKTEKTKISLEKRDSGSDLSSSILDNASENTKRNEPKSDEIFSELEKPQSELSSFKENIVLMPHELKVISNNLSGERLNNSLQPVVVHKSESNFEKNVNLEPRLSSLRSESTSIAEVIDNFPNDHLLTKKTNDIVSKTPFNPEVFQATEDVELNLLDLFQQTLSQFLETERVKLAESNKVFNEKAINTDKLGSVAVQTSVFSERTESLALSETEPDDSSIHTEIQETSSSTTIKEISPHASSKRKLVDSSSESTGISLQMLKTMLKDEELRSEHQLALIELRRKSLVEKTKAEVAILEVKKKEMKHKGASDRAISAIKKRQRGILLKYDQELMEIDRLKKMYHIASEERNIMVKQHTQIRKMQVSTKDILNRLKRPHPSEEMSDVTEETPESTVNSIKTSSVNDMSRILSEGEEEILKRNQKMLQQNIIKDIEKLDKCRKFLGEREEKLVQQRHFVEEILQWESRLQDEETKLREMKRKAINLSGRKKLVKNLDCKDRSTSPFQFQNNSVSEQTRTSTIAEDITNQESSIAEEVVEDNSKVSNSTHTVTTDYTSESFESSAETQRQEETVVTLKNSPEVSKRLSFRLPPRLHPPKRSNSSGSDHSTNQSFTETDASDVEGKIAALNEQLCKRKLEADRLRKEQKKLSRERLKAKEESLLKQIQAYDTYIEKLKNELEQESEKSSHPVVKPLIKQPKAEKNHKISLREEAKKQVKSSSGSISENIEEKSSLEGDVAEIDKEFSESLKSVEEEEEKPVSVIENIQGQAKQSESVVDDGSQDTIDEHINVPEEETESGDTLKTDSVLNGKNSNGSLKVSQSAANESINKESESPTSLEANEARGGGKSIESFLAEDEIDHSSSISEHISILTDLGEPDNKENLLPSKEISCDEEREISQYSTDDFESIDASEHLEDSDKGRRIIDAITDSILGEIIDKSLNIAQSAKKRFLADSICERIFKEEFEEAWKIVIQKKSVTVNADYDRVVEGSHVAEDLSVQPAQQIDDRQWVTDKHVLNKARKEAEQLRLQQLHIEQEIEQLQAQQELEEVPYFYLREIPNKPPPPYKPPTNNDQPPLSLFTESEVTSLVNRFADKLYDDLSLSRSVQPPSFSESYQEFLFDLTHHTMKEIMQVDCMKSNDEILPWESVPLSFAVAKSMLRKRTRQAVVSDALKKILGFLGLRSAIGQESLLARWSRKKRDQVDQLLISECKEEDAEWMRQEEEVVQVKNDITANLLDTLLQETADCFQEILRRKVAKVET